MCGEKIWENRQYLTKKGSPPRVRGKGVNVVDFIRHSGITPACAGKSKDGLLSYALSRDHPRVCGEKFFLVGLDTDAKGSPPRVRGKALFADFQRTGEGITPACAGKSTVNKGQGRDDGDHPRVCGEKLADKEVS